MGIVVTNVGGGIVAEGSSLYLDLYASQSSACLHRFCRLGDATSGTDVTRWETYVVAPASGTYAAWSAALLAEYGTDSVATEQGTQTVATWWAKTRAEDREAMHQAMKRTQALGWMGA